MLRNGPFWMLAGAVLVLFFLPLGPFWFAWAVFDLHWGRFGDGPFWSVPIHLLCHIFFQSLRHYSVHFNTTMYTLHNIHEPKTCQATCKLVLTGDLWPRVATRIFFIRLARYRLFTPTCSISARHSCKHCNTLASSMPERSQLPLCIEWAQTHPRDQQQK